jgi:hypothetical protein
MGAGMLVHWAIGAGLVAWLLVQRLRPLDFVFAYLVLVAGGCFVMITAGGLTYQLSYLTVGVLVMLACYGLVKGRDAFGVPRTSMTLPLLLYCALSIANTVRGVIAGYSLHYVLLEIYPILALGTASLVANAFQHRRDLRPAMLSLVLIAFAISARGYGTFASHRWHTTIEYTVATPGIIGILLINLALRSSTWRESFGWTLLSVPLFVHQLLTFGRGLWTGCIGGLVAAFLIYARFGRGAAPRVRRAALLYVSIAVIGAAGAVAAATAIGDVSILQGAGMRLFSITTSGSSNESEYESRSNVIRFWEYATMFKHIWQSPWVGHGIGFSVPVKEPFSGVIAEQNYAHESYVIILLKQGILGLAVFLWLLVASIAMSARAAGQTADPWESAWFATAATTTVFLAIFSLSSFPFAVVNEMFLLALLWGGAMSMTDRGRLFIRWTP